MPKSKAPNIESVLMHENLLNKSRFRLFQRNIFLIIMRKINLFTYIVEKQKRLSKILILIYAHMSRLQLLYQLPLSIKVIFAWYYQVTSRYRLIATQTFKVQDMKGFEDTYSYCVVVSVDEFEFQNYCLFTLTFAL